MLSIARVELLLCTMVAGITDLEVQGSPRTLIRVRPSAMLKSSAALWQTTRKRRNEQDFSWNCIVMMCGMGLQSMRSPIRVKRDYCFCCYLMFLCTV